MYLVCWNTARVGKCPISGNLFLSLMLAYARDDSPPFVAPICVLFLKPVLSCYISYMYIYIYPNFADVFSTNFIAKVSMTINICRQALCPSVPPNLSMVSETYLHQQDARGLFFFRNTDCVWGLNQREKDAALFVFTGSRNPYAVWSNLGLRHSTFSDTSIFLLFVFNPTRKHHEMVCQNPLKCLHEVICDQTIVVIAIFSWYVVVTVTPKRIEKIEKTFITYHYFSRFYQVLSCWGL